MVENKTVRLRYMPEFALALRQRNIQAALALPRSFQQKLQRQRRLAGAGVALDQIQKALGQTTMENIVQAGYSGR